MSAPTLQLDARTERRVEEAFERRARGLDRREAIMVEALHRLPVYLAVAGMASAAHGPAGCAG